MVLNPVNILPRDMEYYTTESRRDIDVVSQMSSNKRMILMKTENGAKPVNTSRKVEHKKKQKVPNPASIVRRNERERNRIKLINSTFSSLRNCLPTTLDTKKRRRMSKVDILRNAAFYIRKLSTVIKQGGPDHEQRSPDSPSSCPPTIQTTSPEQTFYSSPSCSPSSDNDCYSPQSQPDYTATLEHFMYDRELVDVLEDWLD